MITKEEIILSRFKHATRPHDPPMNTIQLNLYFGPPKPKVSELNAKELHRRFTEVHYMCGGLHKRYEW
jgi:hypothetical protein